MLIVGRAIKVIRYCTNQQQIDQIKPDGSDGQLGDNQHPGLDRERVHQIALVGIEIL